MQFTKSQVISLFLASVSAQGVTIDDLIDGNCSSTTAAPGTLATALATCSSKSACTNNSGCTTTGEVCGTWVETGNTALDIVQKCVHKDQCNNLGKRNNIAFTVACTDTGAAPTQLPVPATLLTTVETTITTAGAGAWSAVQNMKVPSLDNFQTGWWIRGSDVGTAAAVYTETDKPVVNKCADNSGCATGECCANWPDSNNKRCIASAKGGVKQTLAPFKDFTPTCIASGGGAPVSAADDLKNQALANAAQQLTAYETTLKDAWKLKTGYATKTTADQAKLDAEWTADRTKATAFATKMGTLAGYDSLTTEQKTVYKAEQLKLAKAVAKVCTDAEKSIDCIDYEKIAEATETARKAAGYYALDATARAAWDTTHKETIKATKATLTAAWKKANTATAGALKGACSATAKCTDNNHCCGTFTATAAGADGKKAEYTGRCWYDPMDTDVTDAQKSLKFEELGVTFSHVCGAQKLVATAAALFAAASLM